MTAPLEELLGRYPGATVQMQLEIFFGNDAMTALPFAGELATVAHSGTLSGTRGGTTFPLSAGLAVGVLVTLATLAISLGVGSLRRRNRRFRESEIAQSKSFREIVLEYLTMYPFRF